MTSGEGTTDDPDRPGATPADPWLLDRTAPVRRAWLEPLARWLVAEWRLDDSPRRLLDVGCGDLQLLHLLPAHTRLDGHDLSEAARRAAAAQLRRTGRAGAIYDRVDDLPEGTYDGVVLSSVVQYLRPDELEQLLRRLSATLAPGGIGVIVTDAVTGRRRPVGEVRATWSSARSVVGRRGAAAWLVRSAARGPWRLWQIDAGELPALAARAGLTCTQVSPNLSGFEDRSSFLLAPMERPTGSP